MSPVSRQAGFGVLVSILALSWIGCERDQRSAQQHAAPVVAVTSKSSTQPAVPLQDVKRVAAPPRLVAIGDLHGDIEATRAALRLGGAIDERDHWVGGPLVVVQTGDQLDRGDDERIIIDMLDRWSAEAKAVGGAVIVLNGNHEVMNVQGDFRYVTSGGFRSFASVSPQSPASMTVLGLQKERAGAFLPGGAYAQKLATRDVVAIVGTSVFVHGGLLPQHLDYGLERISREVRAWMQGGAPEPSPQAIGERSPIWLRDYGTDRVTSAACDALNTVLQRLGVNRLVVGHTVQESGINSACGERVFRIDVGLSRAYGQHPIQVLEVIGDQVKILTGARDQLLGTTAPKQAASASR